MLRDLTRIPEIVWQVKSYSKIFSGGCHRLILGGTTTLPASHATLGLRPGSFREKHSLNGRHLEA